MKFSIDKKEKHCVISLQEEKLTSLIAPDLKSEFVLLNAEGFKNIILDLMSVKFADSSGLSSILIANRLCSTANGTFVICNVQENVMKLLKISQLDTILHIIPTLQEAVELVIMEEIERDVNDKK